MHGTVAFARDLAGAIAARADDYPDVDIAVCPPHVLLPAVADVLAGSAVGHFERRTLFGETSAIVAAKAQAALAAGLTPVICVGEQLEDRKAGTTNTVIASQLEPLATGVLVNCVVAYEPVWAIGTGETASPEQAQAVHAFIRKTIAARDAAAAAATRILYGGSVKPDNAAELFQMADVDGGLIGGAALKAPDFLQICGSL